MPQSTGKGYKTLKDLVRIISLFNSYEIEERSVTEISKLLGMHPSKVSRMLSTLETEGFFRKNPQTRKYRLGIEFFRLGIAYAHHSPLRKIVRPHLEQMAKEVSLTAACGVLKNGNIVLIDRVENLTIDLISVRLVLNLPIHATAIGRALLAYVPENEQGLILRSVELKKFTSSTVVDLSSIKENLNLIRKNGYAVDLGETHEDVNSIAAPVKSSDSRVVAAIGLTGDKLQLPRDKVPKLLPYLAEKAYFISRQLGYANDT
jgi:DNA-binding IclR family transcriptional regulator